MDLFLLGIIAVVAVLSGIRDNHKVHRALNKKTVRSQIVPKGLTLLILTAQVSELVKVVEHASIVNISAALMLLAIIIATKSGTDNTNPH